MTLEEMEKNLARLKEAGRIIVGEDVPPLEIKPKEKRHVPEPGKTWSGYLRRLERARGEKDK